MTKKEYHKKYYKENKEQFKRYYKKNKKRLLSDAKVLRGRPLLRWVEDGEIKRVYLGDIPVEKVNKILKMLR